MTDLTDNTEHKLARAIQDKCLTLLARREHSHDELLNKLTQRGYQSADILPVLEQLSVQGWQSDARYVADYVWYRSQRGYGPERIVHELQAKGVAKTLVTDMMRGKTYIVAEMSVTVPDIDWIALAVAAHQKKFKQLVPVTLEAQHKSQQFLRYRGFNYEQINMALAVVADGAFSAEDK